MSAHPTRVAAVLACAALVFAGSLRAQAPAGGQRGRGQAAPLPYDPSAVSQASIDNYREQNVDPGVFYAVIMDRPEVRIGHTRLAPGGARRTHTHDDVTWHLLIPVTGTLTMTVGNDPPLETVPGKAYFMKAGTPHSFTNKGTSDALSIEVFVKPAPKDAARASGQPNIEEMPASDALAFAFGAASGAQR
jgi:quercetin dioxygenase-like cupin family protein